MRKETRFKFNAYMTQLAALNGVDVETLSKKFSVEPSVTQALMEVVQESSDFLTRINIVPVAELTGEKIGLGVSGSVASTTDTSSGDERETADLLSLEARQYKCEQMNFDFHIRYNTLDLWARFQDFQLRLRNAIAKRQSLDYIMAGWHGVKRAATSDRAKNPLLQDVAVGWLQKYRNESAKRVMGRVVAEDGTVISEQIRVGENGDYESLDALVMDATNTMIDEWHQEDPDLVVICGRQLLSDKYFPLVNKQQENSEILAADVIVSQKRIGNLPAVRVPYFPANALMVNRLDNLSIYYMDDSHRRHIEEVAKRDRIENYESIKQDYVVEDYGCGCVIENIQLGKFPKPPEAEKAAEPAPSGTENPTETSTDNAGA
ncbi:phage major capsid protein, P2 family [Pectobacterium quasiaquaticum]|uniref:phage major capsid protein, P2 family n=1 Tax=Pectobacterium TaxID=122277 RepID=UPI00102ECA2E|nr:MULTISPECIES: phage major capsid protein, P2 family [Pectobacterium]TAI86929.1 phage major capsid protein, P2 family [Pectobacterium versatile]URG53672.1 phage major capsid protein, P2 family [Pectobacterium quasiaquaticum]WJM82667.1 phage major capsid protein, P2 family [Pectobacterium brasiliense]